jgi:hypothetical protein
MFLEFIFKIRGISNQVIYLLIYFLLELSLKLLVTITIAEICYEYHQESDVKSYGL